MENYYTKDTPIDNRMNILMEHIKSITMKVASSFPPLTYPRYYSQKYTDGNSNLSFSPHCVFCDNQVYALNVDNITKFRCTNCGWEITWPIPMVNAMSGLWSDIFKDKETACNDCDREYENE